MQNHYNNVLVNKFVKSFDLKTLSLNIILVQQEHIFYKGSINNTFYLYTYEKC